LWELTRAYATMARGGAVAPLHLLEDAPTTPALRVGERPVWELVTDMLADAHARAKSFGVHSVLEMPFPAAVKTGTSSDFRDTWTVGFSRDYTVGVWVGNFDGSAMHRVSGVTGAGPLWNRIMLHLHERDEPAAFVAPAGYVRMRICATTGHAPLPDCPAVVQEWVRERDVASVRHAVAPHLGTEYDTWLALHPESQRSPVVRIVFPRNGDVFVRNAVTSTLQAPVQQLALRAVGAGRAIRWSVGGRPVPFDAAGTAFWPLALGTWTLEASDGRQTDRVTIHVVNPERFNRPGFTRS
jgi:penicillin-binding protein 1C